MNAIVERHLEQQRAAQLKKTVDLLRENAAQLQTTASALEAGDDETAQQLLRALQRTLDLALQAWAYYYVARDTIVEPGFGPRHVPGSNGRPWSGL